MKIGLLLGLIALTGTGCKPRSYNDADATQIKSFPKGATIYINPKVAIASTLSVNGSIQWSNEGLASEPRFLHQWLDQNWNTLVGSWWQQYFTGPTVGKSKPVVEPGSKFYQIATYADFIENADYILTFSVPSPEVYFVFERDGYEKCSFLFGLAAGMKTSVTLARRTDGAIATNFIQIFGYTPSRRDQIHPLAKSTAEKCSNWVLPTDTYRTPESYEDFSKRISPIIETSLSNMRGAKSVADMIASEILSPENITKTANQLASYLTE